MKIRQPGFNIYLLLVLPVVFGSLSCRTAEERQKANELSTIRFHLEVNADGTPFNSGVTIFRAMPILVNIARDALLDERDVDQAGVIDTEDGFAIRIQFNRHGAIVLENTTTSYKGQRLAILSEFGESRWLAAPLINRRIENGLFVFTPDATREEAERIVRGLNNAVHGMKSKI
jgi:hypothetical protein